MSKGNVGPMGSVINHIEKLDLSTQYEWIKEMVAGGSCVVPPVPRTQILSMRPSRFFTPAMFQRLLRLGKPGVSWEDESLTLCTKQPFNPDKTTLSQTQMVPIFRIVARVLNMIRGSKRAVAPPSASPRAWIVAQQEFLNEALLLCARAFLLRPKTGSPRMYEQVMTILERRCVQDGLHPVQVWFRMVGAASIHGSLSKCRTRVEVMLVNLWSAVIHSDANPCVPTFTPSPALIQWFSVTTGDTTEWIQVSRDPDTCIVRKSVFRMSKPRPEAAHMRITDAMELPEPVLVSDATQQQRDEVAAICRRTEAGARSALMPAVFQPGRMISEISLIAESYKTPLFEDQMFLRSRSEFPTSC